MIASFYPNGGIMKKGLLVFFILFCQILRAIHTSIVVPCSVENIPYLPELIESYNCQTVMPDEMIITLSEISKMDIEYIQEIEDCKDIASFKLLFLIHPKKISMGEQRNFGCKYAKGEILICNNPDDIPHFQRVELINKIFHNTQCDLIIHKWMLPTGINEFNKYHDITNLKFYKIKDWNPAHLFGTMNSYGNIAFKKKVVEKIKWRSVQKSDDIKFVQDAMKTGYQILLLNADLILSRKE